MEPHNNAVTSKLNTLLRLGLVSKNNVRRAAILFADPDKAMKNPSYRLLMQEILVDVIDRVLNNKALYAALRTSISKDPTSAAVSEGVGEERTKTLLRSGLVKKKDVVIARRALKDPATAKKMSASRVYRDMMIDMMDSMVKKITGSPTLFNAFRNTLGKDTGENVDESFEVPNAESIFEMMLHESVSELREGYKPSNVELWAEAKSKARTKFDSSVTCSESWAVKWYNENGGEWTEINEGKSFFKFSKELEEGSAVPSKKEAVAAIRWGRKALKNPAAHNISREDILANVQVAKDTLRPFGERKKKPVEEGTYTKHKSGHLIMDKDVEGRVGGSWYSPLRSDVIKKAKKAKVAKDTLRPFGERKKKPVRSDVIKSAMQTRAIGTIDGILNASKLLLTASKKLLRYCDKENNPFVEKLTRFIQTLQAHIQMASTVEKIGLKDLSLQYGMDSSNIVTLVGQFYFVDYRKQGVDQTKFQGLMDDVIAKGNEVDSLANHG